MWWKETLDKINTLKYSDWSTTTWYTTVVVQLPFGAITGLKYGANTVDCNNRWTDWSWYWPGIAETISHWLQMKKRKLIVIYDKMSIKGKFSKTLVERMVKPNWSNVTDVITSHANVVRQTQRRRKWLKLIAFKLFRCMSNETTNVEIIMIIRKYNQTFKAEPNKRTSHAYQRIKYDFYNYTYT